jgi:hypothetical protein
VRIVERTVRVEFADGRVTARLDVLAEGDIARPAGGAPAPGG